jgi:hypothetical protein
MPSSAARSGLGGGAKAGQPQPGAGVEDALRGLFGRKK